MSDDQSQLRELRSNLQRRLEGLKTEFFSDNAARDNAINGSVQKRRELKGHFQKVYAIHWAGRASDLLVSASQDSKLIVWNANSTNKLYAIPLKHEWVMCCAFEQTGNQNVASGGLDNVCSVYRLWENDVGQAMRPEHELEGHVGYISACRFLDDKKIVTSSGDSTCRVWDLPTGRCQNYFKEHERDVMSVSPHPDNPNVFVSGSVDLECKVWDIRVAAAVGTQKPAGGFNMYGDDDEIEGTEVEQKFTYTGHESDVNCVAFFPDGFAFASGSDDASCRLFDMRCYQEINVFKHQTILCGVTSVAFSKSGRLLFAGYDDHNVLGWDVLKNPSPESGDSEPVMQWRAHEGRVSCLSVHSEGQAFATGSWDSLIKVYA